MSLGINVLKELKLVLKKKQTDSFLLDVQNICDYANDIYEEVKDTSNSEEYAISWSDEATMCILAIANHFLKDGWTNTSYKEFANQLTTLYKSKEFINWCLIDNNSDVVATHLNDGSYSTDISNCFYIQILNDYAYFLQKVAKAKQEAMLSRLDKTYATKALKTALKLIKYTLDLYEYL